MVLIKDKFWSCVDKQSSKTGCWLWTGTVNNQGYGRISYLGKVVFAHRLVWFLAYGEQPDGYILHSCDNPPCVNPSHLRVGTAKENAQDKCDRDRNFTELVRSQVIEIKKLLKMGWSCIKIAKRYDVIESTIWNIKAGKTWKHIVTNEGDSNMVIDDFEKSECLSLIQEFKQTATVSLAKQTNSKTEYKEIKCKPFTGMYYVERNGEILSATTSFDIAIGDFNRIKL